jgi:hypothetical protein
MKQAPGPFFAEAFEDVTIIVVGLQFQKGANAGAHFV